MSGLVQCLEGQPPEIEPSPITAMTRTFSPLMSLAAIMPSAAEIEVLAWPMSKWSHGVSSAWEIR